MAVTFTVPVVLPATIVAVVVTAAPFGVTVLGLNEQFVPLSPEQEKLTEPVKLLTGVTVIVAVPLCPGKSLRLVVVELAVKSGGLAAAVSKLFTSTEPNPVTRSYPVPAENPNTPVLGHHNDEGCGAPGVLGLQYTLLSPIVMS